MTIQLGDIVSWVVGNSLPHIGIVVKEKSNLTNRPLVKHNIGADQITEDVLFHWKIEGYFQYKSSK